MSIEYAIAKTLQSVVPTCLQNGNNWYYESVFVREKRKDVLFAAESQLSV